MRAEEPLPRDPRLDPFRDAVWQLSRNGNLQAHLITQVSYFRYWPFGQQRRECMWSKVCWLDGSEDVPEDDYGPEWYTVADLERGKYETTTGVFDASRVEGPLRNELWERYGPP
jgi:hypothetical protein